MSDFFVSLAGVTAQMSPYLLLGFLIAGILHVYVPGRFYTKYLSSGNRLSVLYAALLGVPLPLCSCGVIPTAIGLKNERASNGAVASFLIATPQTGIDSILATFSVLGLGFALMRPAAALITGVCGGLIVNRLVPGRQYDDTPCAVASAQTGNRLFRVFRYACFDMIQDIGARLLIGLIIAALIKVILVVAVPMYICSTGSIPVAAALIMKGMSPGAAMVMLMAGPAVNMASILVIRKSMGGRFTAVYISTIVVFSILFGLLVNTLGIGSDLADASEMACHHTLGSNMLSPWRIICSVILILLIIFALSMKLFDKFRKQPAAAGTVVYKVEGMHCNHCKASVENSVLKVKGVQSALANLGAGTLTVTGTAKESEIRRAVEQAGFEMH